MVAILGLANSVDAIGAVHIHSSGRRASFDASSWFEQATDDEIHVPRSMSYHAFFADPPADCAELTIHPDDAESRPRANRPELLV